MSQDLTILPRPRVMYAVVFRAPKKRGEGMTKEKWLWWGNTGQMVVYDKRHKAQSMAALCNAHPDSSHPDRIYSVRPFWGEA